MTINPDQAIFDAIVAAIQPEPQFGNTTVINVQTFIETFNGHRDRKLCTSIDSYEVTHLKAMLANEHQKMVPDEERWRIAPVYEAMEAALEIGKPSLLQRARQFVADSGCDEDNTDVNAERDRLLSDIDAVAHSHSPPAFHAPHNHGERLPSGDAAEAGGEAMNIDRYAVARLLAEALLHILHGENDQAVTKLQLVLSVLTDNGGEWQ